MDISRHGAERYHGPSTTTLRSTTVSWNKDKRAVEMKSYYVPDFNTDAHHNYTVTVSLSEVAEVFRAVAKGAEGEGRRLVGDALAPALAAILTIALACAEQAKGSSSAA